MIWPVLMPLIKPTLEVMVPMVARLIVKDAAAI